DRRHHDRGACGALQRGQIRHGRTMICGPARKLRSRRRTRIGGEMLVGRKRELETALAVCRAAEQGRGSVLVVLGEPGIGKTALLGEIGSTTQSRHVLRATGVEAESTVAFATLQGLLWPLREEIDGLEPGQRALLRGVLDLGSQHSTSTFAIGAAVLNLLPIASPERAAVALV